MGSDCILHRQKRNQGWLLVSGFNDWEMEELFTKRANTEGGVGCAGRQKGPWQEWWDDRHCPFKWLLPL